MKVLLIQPPIQDFYDTDIRLQPLGLCYLKAALKQHCPEVSVTVRDFHHGPGRKTIPIPKELRYLKDYYACPNTTPFSSFHQYYHFGLSFEEIAEEVGKEVPNLVGISSLFAPYYREVHKCAEAIKNRLNVPIVVGGGQATCSPELMLSNASIDYVIRGEGEKPLVELVKALAASSSIEAIGGLGYKKMGQAHLNPIGSNYPFESLPCPDFSDLRPGEYLYKNRPLAFLQSSRGCPHRCSFCSVHQIFGRAYRKRSPEKIVAEMELRYQKGYRTFDFEDDNLTLDKNHILELCHQIRQKWSQNDITLLAMNGISYKNLDAEVLGEMKKTGFTRLNLALVSSEQKTLQALNRPHRADLLTDVVQTAFSLGFDLEVHQIIGLPGETLDSMESSMAFLARMPVLIGVSIFYLTPKTEIAARFPDMNEKDIFISRSTAMAFPNTECDRDDLFTLFTTARIINFLKGISIREEEIPLAELLQKEWEDERFLSGMKVLEMLLEGKKFHTFSKGAFREHGRFKYSTFERIWLKSSAIVTQKGKKILLRDALDRLRVPRIAAGPECGPPTF